MDAVERRAYPSDLTDEEWEIINELIPPALPGGRPRGVDMRMVVNAIFYQNRTGCQWRFLPHDLVPKSTAYEYFSRWRKDGTWQNIVEVVRRGVRALEAPSGEPEASTASIDSQSVKSGWAGAECGYDGGKKISGRKRHLAVDSLGLLMVIVVTAASIDDGVAAPQVLSQLDRETHPRLNVVHADNKYHNHNLNDWLEQRRKSRRHSWELNIVSRPRGAKGFVKLPKRWVVERTISWLSRNRRLSKDYERLTTSSESQVRVAAVRHMLRRLTAQPTHPPFKYRVAK